MIRLIIFILMIVSTLSCSESNETKVHYFEVYKSGITNAKKNNKKILLMFDSVSNPTGSTFDFLHDREVYNTIGQQYVCILLFFEDSDQYNDTLTYGQYNLRLRDDKFGIKSSPLYYILDSNENVLQGPLGYCKKEEFIEFLKLELED